MKQVGHATLTVLLPVGTKEVYLITLLAYASKAVHRTHQHVLRPELIWVVVDDRLSGKALFLWQIAHVQGGPHAANWFWLELAKRAASRGYGTR